MGQGSPRGENNGISFGEAALCYTFRFFDVFFEVSGQEAQGLAMLAMLAK
jgi:hypothetical protein